MDAFGVALPPAGLAIGEPPLPNPAFEETLPPNIKEIDTDAGDVERNGLVPIAFSQSSAGKEPVAIKVGQAHRNLIVFPADGDKLAGDLLGLPGTELAGTERTVVSGAGGVITLHVGDVSVAAAKSPVKIATVLAGLKTDPHSVVRFSFYPDERFSIANLSANGHAVNVRVARDPSNVRTLSAGDCISSDNAGRQIASTHESAGDNLLTDHPAGVTAPIRMLAAQGTEFVPEKNAVHLINGSCFLDIPAGYQITTAIGTVFATKRALVRVERRRGMLRVECCSGPGAAVFVSGHTKVPLERAEELLITDHKPMQSEAVPGDGIGRRSFSMQTTDNGLSAVLSDFSVYSLLSSQDYMAPIKNPSNAIDRSILDRLVQTSSAIDYAMPHRPRYFVQQGKDQ